VEVHFNNFYLFERTGSVSELASCEAQNNWFLITQSAFSSQIKEVDPEKKRIIIFKILLF
jgi:hypothetical protein